MVKRILSVLMFFGLGFGILVVSVLKSASVDYAFSKTTTPSPAPAEVRIEIPYFVPYAGKIGPDSPLWSLKALRDKVWLLVTTNLTKKAEILLLLADKRIALAQELMGEKNSELAVSTLTKAEKYLEEAVAQEKVARAKGVDTVSLLTKLSLATLKHRQMLEEILAGAPEDAKPVIVTTMDLTKKLYEDTKASLTSLGRPVPENPFKD